MPRAGSSGGTSSGDLPAAWSSPGPSKAAAPTRQASGGGGADTGPSQVGVASLDVSTPAGITRTLTQSGKEGGNFIDMLGKGIFGDKRVKGEGSVLGQVPVLGDVGRAIGDNPLTGWVGEVAKLPFTVIGGAADVVGGALEHVTLGNTDLTSRYQQQVKDPALLSKANEEIAKDPGRAQHLMYEAIVAQVKQDQASGTVKPNLTADIGPAPSGSWADSISNVLGLLQVPVRHIERGAAGWKKADGLDRLDAIDAVMRGGSGFVGGGGSGATPVEQIAWTQWKAGNWSHAEALDFLASHGSGFAHDPNVELISSVGLDPQVWGSLGSAAIAKLGGTAAKLAARGAEQIALGTEVIPLRAAGSAGRFNVLGKVAEKQVTNDFLRAYGAKVYAPLEGSSLGTAAKVARTIIDPFHAIGTSTKSEALADLYSESTSRAVNEGYGHGNAAKVMEWAHGVSPELYGALADDLGVYAANVGRTVLGRFHQAAQVLQGLAEELVHTSPGDIVNSLAKAGPKDLPQLIKDAANRVRETVWDEPAKQKLADRMTALYGHLSTDEYLTSFAKMNYDQLGYLHALTYGRATTNFLEAVAKSVTKYTGKVPLARAVLLNRGTLTDLGARGILDSLAAPVLDAAGNAVKDAKGVAMKQAVSQEKAAELIRAAQDLYPDLRYITIRDGAEQAKSIEQFQKWLTSRLGSSADDMRLPHEWTHAEIAAAPQELQDFVAKHGDAFTIGFRPADDLLWGLERGLDGKYASVFDPWVDHVGIGAAKARPIGALAYNLAGMPLIGGRVANGLAKGMDYLEAGARTITAQVTSASITDNARVRFMRIGQMGKESKVSGLSVHGGLTETETARIWDAITEAAQIHKRAVRGLSESDMWGASQHLVPGRLAETGLMTSRDLRNMVLDAWEGDLRYVGLTQKLTGRAKTLLGPLGGNFVGQIAEGLYPDIKFRMNALFQLQEKVEPIVLNSQRGVRAILGSKLDANDRIAAAVLDRMAETGMARIGDIDLVEYSKLVLAGKDGLTGIEGIASKSWLEQMVGVSATKRANMLRTFEHKLGASIKPSMERNLPGLWDELRQGYEQAAKRVLSDDEVALRYLGEQVLGSDISVSTLIRPGHPVGNFDAAIKSAEFWQPKTLGALRPLQLDFMSQRLGLAVKDGSGGSRVLGSADEVRAALADKTLTMDRVTEALHNIGAHEDYINRVERSLNFHWDPFFSTLSKRFNLSAGERAGLEGMFARSAKMRGMTPIEFASQVFDPYIGVGKEADVVSSLEKGVNTIRAISGKKGTPEQLFHQVADVFSDHLDPSARQGLLMHFEQDLPKRIQQAYDSGNAALGQDLQRTLESLKGGWTPEASKQFGQDVLRYAETGAGNPDVIRAAQFFGEWTKGSIFAGIKGDKQFAAMLEKVAKLPTDAGSAANHMSQLMADQIAHAMRAKMDDAFRLQYFARTRSFAERSLNHPFFGLYPSSYMFGKIAPELFRFMMKEPFGIRTGAASYAFNRLQTSMAIQREWDPEFDKLIETLGHNQAVWFLGYLLPSVPWDIGSAFPTYLRDIAAQAQDNQARIDQGQQPRPINLHQSLTKVGDYVSPFRPVEQVTRAIGGVGDLLKPKPGTAPATVSPTSQNVPATKGVDLGNVLTPEFADLQRVLSGK